LVRCFLEEHTEAPDALEIFRDVMNSNWATELDWKIAIQMENWACGSIGDKCAVEQYCDSYYILTYAFYYPPQEFGSSPSTYNLFNEGGYTSTITQSGTFL